jgi:hypothetical protein
MYNMPKRTVRRGRGRGKKSRGKKQKIYNMKGCSKGQTKCRSRKQKGGYGCGAYGCPLAPFSWKQMQQRGGEYANVMNGAPILGTAQTGGTCGACQMKGGSCGSCSNAPLMQGGSFYKSPSPMPGPFIGQNWSPFIKGWPGVDGISNNRNYLANNLYNAGDPQTMMKLGGSKKMNKSMNKKGGGLIPQDLVNLGRDFSFNLKSAYNTLNGYSSPTNPLPYKDQLSSSISANRIII